MTDLEWIARHLADFFKDEPHKAVMWPLIPNPMFGSAPGSLILAERAHKVKAWMEANKWENSLPGTPEPKTIAEAKEAERLAARELLENAGWIYCGDLFPDKETYDKASAMQDAYAAARARVDELEKKPHE